MKSIVCINMDIPTVEDSFSYSSDRTIRDYDIAVFNPQFPYLERIPFSGGGSAYSIESMTSLQSCLSHWKAEFRDAMRAGKTVFVLLNSVQEDTGAVGSKLVAKNSRNYTTRYVSNYEAVPFSLKRRNVKGKSIIVKDPNFKALFRSIESALEYRVILESEPGVTPICEARDGSIIGASIRIKDGGGHMILLPFFDFTTQEFIAYDAAGREQWTEEALKASRALVTQLVAVDKALRGSTEISPAPDWLSELERPNGVEAVEAAIEDLDERAKALATERTAMVATKDQLLEWSHLLYESGKGLEKAVERSLRLLGYNAGGFENGDVEIDHIFVGPSGVRMIGETEGKESSAVDISKFRQLESNIAEDFEKDDISVPAKGVLFGNGYRFRPPSERPCQFTDKCIVNAKRLGSALVQTSDLYEVVLCILNDPSDDDFKAECRLALEATFGDVVVFPSRRERAVIDC